MGLFFRTYQPGSLATWWRSGRLSQHLLWLACVAGVVGLLSSRALVALSPVAGVVAALANPRLRAELPQWLRLRTVWPPLLLYALVLLSGLYTHNLVGWRHELFRQLPWLGVPLAFGLAVPLTGRQRFSVGVLFVGGAALIGAATMAQYLLDPMEANQAFGIGQSMPSVTRIFHIHFGLILTLATFFGLLLRREQWAGRWVRLGLLLAATICLLTLHVLAYRTGLLALYVVVLTDALLLLARRRLWVGLALLVLLGGVPWLAYQSLESVQQRVWATQYDLHRYERGEDINQFSLARRLAAWQTASVVIRQQPWLGTGAADAYSAMMEQYDWRSYGLRPENRAMVHNQYLHALVAGGVVGLALWLLTLFGPLLQPGLRSSPYVYHFLLVQATAMLVDSLLEMQIGFNLFVFLYGFVVVASERYLRARRQPSAGGPV